MESSVHLRSFPVTMRNIHFVNAEKPQEIGSESRTRRIWDKMITYSMWL